MSVEYCLEVFDSGGTFGPNNKLGEIWDFRNVGWSRYDRLPGKAFATLYQDSPHLTKFSPLLTHVRLWRVATSGNTELYNGKYIDYDSTGDDVILTFFDYIAEFAVSRAGYRTLYPTKKLGTEIAQVEVDAAIAATFSPLGFITRGTVEDPVGQDGVTVITTNSEFGLLDQPRLQLLYDLSEMARANTTNHVTFSISRTAPFTFTFLKNAGTARDIGLTLNGSVTDYDYLPNWSRYRNDIATLGTTVGGGSTEIVETDETAAAARSRRQDVATIKTLLGIVGSAVESDQQVAATSRILTIATKRTPALSIRLSRGTLEPFSGWDICDTTPVEIVNGVDSLTTSQRIVGVRGLYTEAGEDLAIILEPIIT